MAGEKTEKPTPKRRAKARERGQVARSADVNGAVVMIAGLGALAAFGPRMVGGIQDYMRTTIADAAQPGDLGANLQHLAMSAGQVLLVAVAPIALACMVGGVVANVAQVGWKPKLKPLAPDPKRISPLSNFKSMFGARAVFETAKSLWKIAAVGAVVAASLVPRIRELGAATGTPPAALGRMLTGDVFGIAWRAAGAYLVIAFADYAWQRHRHEKSLKMDKQEVKEEYRQQNLAPEVRSAQRRRAAALARARMMAAVPGADVVVVNPTHYAVALRYDGGSEAPEVIAKGADLVAARIREIAKEHGVPVVSDPPLARTLHASVEVGQVIPADLYQAVARVLAFVYGLNARQRRAATA